jgi:intracellular proteinase inhibitor BsuPI
MENRLVITTLCAAAVVYACGPWVQSQTASSGSDSTHSADSRPSAPHKLGIVATELALERTGSRIDFALNVTNYTKKTIELRFPSARTHDIAVLDSTGRTVWRASAGRLFTQTMQALTVRSKDTLTMEDSWDTKGAHGSYTAVALLATGDHPVERRVAFTLP